MDHTPKQGYERRLLRCSVACMPSRRPDKYGVSDGFTFMGNSITNASSALRQ